MCILRCKTIGLDLDDPGRAGQSGRFGGSGAFAAYQRVPRDRGLYGYGLRVLPVSFRRFLDGSSARYPSGCAMGLERPARSGVNSSRDASTSTDEKTYGGEGVRGGSFASHFSRSGRTWGELRIRVISTTPLVIRSLGSADRQ